MTGTHLAVEIPASAPDLRAFVVIRASLPTARGPRPPSRILNKDLEELHFWMRKYEVMKHDLDVDNDIVDEDLLNAVFLRNIETIEQLEKEVEPYVPDVSLLVPAWKVENLLP